MNANVKLGVIGCGKMASAILGGVAASNFINPKNIFLYDINEQACKDLALKYGFNCKNSIKSILEAADIIFLAVKPFKADEVLNEIKLNYKSQLIISILAGVKIQKYLNILPNSKIIRIMPNTPALVNEGMSAVCSSENVSNDEFDFVYNLMSNCGKVIKTTEDKIDIITALSGSGPAYYFKIIDLMAKAAAKLGLNHDEAILLSAQTALGSAKMMIENNFNTELLIKNVTTPGGCTEVGNNVLLNSNIDEILDKTIKDTMLKAVSLG